MANFALFFPKLMGHEGGYVWNPADPGAETYAGVARRYNPQWSGWQLVDAAKKKLMLVPPIPVNKYAALNAELAAQPTMKGLLSGFYQANYWNPLLLNSVNNQLLAEQLADHGASAGIWRAAEFIQYAINEITPTNKVRLIVDGIVGPKTITAINAADQTALLKAFVDLRRAQYGYRAGVTVPDTQILALFKSLKIYPDPASRQFLNSWLNRLPKV